jgi:hypothetical protein
LLIKCYNISFFEKLFNVSKKNMLCVILSFVEGVI